MKTLTKVGALLIGLTLLLSGCQEVQTSSAQAKGAADTEEAFAKQSDAVPYPKDLLHDSLERRNLRERLLRQNKPNAIGYVYIMGMTGNAVGYFVIKGKVSSTQSQMTTDQLVTWSCPYKTCSNSIDSYVANVVTAPGDDGSYGDNEPGIFFFTTEGTMVTTSMEYFVSDQPLPLDAPKLNPNKK